MYCSSTLAASQLQYSLNCCFPQAVSVAVLGKLCLQHESQAKRIIPALGRMLDTNPGPDIKTNIIFTLSDMCVRYVTRSDILVRFVIF